MSTFIITAQSRDKGIKNASKKAFRNHQIVGVLYSYKENFPILFDRHDFEKMVPKIRSNTLLKVKVGDEEKTAFIKDYSFFLKNHRIQHVDFQEIVPGRSVNIYIPLEYSGVPVGVSKGGFVQIFARSIRVKCDSQKIPETIKIDLSNVDINQSIYLKEISPMEGVKYLESPDLTLVSVAISSRKKSEGGAEQAAAAAPAPAADKKKAVEKK